MENSWFFVEEENVYIKKLYKDENVEMILAKIPAKDEMKTHVHERPDNGTENYIFQNGGHFVLLPENKTYETEKAFELVFKSGEPHGIKNLSDKDLIFIAVYTPPFKEGESKIL